MKEIKFTIPILVSPFPDELLFNYILRIGKINSLEMPSYILDFFFNKKTIRSDTLIPLGRFFDLCNFSNPMDIFYKTSVVPLIFPFIGDSVKEIIMKRIFSTKNMYRYITYGYIIEKTKICPICAKQDKEKYGEIYLHRSHQVVGVNICYKHRCALLESNFYLHPNSDGSNSIKSEFKYHKTKVCPLNDYDNPYAEFIYLMLNDRKSINMDNFTYDFYKEIVRRFRFLHTRYDIKFCDLETLESYNQIKEKIRLFCN